MNKHIRRLQLSRETLTHLTLHRRIAGGTHQTGVPGCDFEQDDTGAGSGPIYTGPFFTGCPSCGAYCTAGC